MTDQTFTNVASGDAHVELQVGVVHGDIRYEIAPDASPHEVFELGVRLLDARIPAEARMFIEKAVARGLNSDRVRFYRLLALLSGRTLRQLSNDDLDRLDAVCRGLTPSQRGGAWAAGLRAVLALLGSLSSTEAARIDKELDALPPVQRDLIVDHLGVLLEGPMEDEMWRRSVDLARTRRTDRNRTDRVWMFFQPEPARARVRGVRPSAYQLGDVVLGVLGIVAGLIFAIQLVVSLVRQGEVLPIAGVLLAVAGVVLSVRYGAAWHFRRERIRRRDAELIFQPRGHQAPPDGFARSVDNLFDHYFGRYLPQDIDRASWVEYTAGIRQRLRDELVEIYREQRVHAKQIAWLVRYLAGDVRRQWERETLFSYRTDLRTPGRDKALCWAGAALLGASGLVVITGAPLVGALWGLAAAIAGTVAVRAGLRLDSERRRAGADAADGEAELRRRQAAYDRWVAKLSVKPTDQEMAEWLQSDRRILFDGAMRHYRLKASEIIAHAVVEGPGTGAKRARVKHGPSRYSRYRMVLFLLTNDGVRQINVDLEFEPATGQITQRLNYRFDAVASVRISGLATYRQTFELTLLNGPAITMPVTEATGEMEPGEDPARLSEVSLDASGLPHTLHVLEGIAAEGKEWVHHQHQRTDQRLTDLASTAQQLLQDP